MKSALILAVVVAAYCLTACGGSDDNEPEQPCQTDAPTAACMDKAPTEPRRITAQ